MFFSAVWLCGVYGRVAELLGVRGGLYSPTFVYTDVMLLSTFLSLKALTA